VQYVLHVAAFLLLAWSYTKFNRYWSSEPIYRYVDLLWIF